MPPARSESRTHNQPAQRAPGAGRHQQRTRTWPPAKGRLSKHDANRYFDCLRSPARRIARNAAAAVLDDEKRLSKQCLGSIVFFIEPDKQTDTQTGINKLSTIRFVHLRTNLHDLRRDSSMFARGHQQSHSFHMSIGNARCSSVYSR